VTAFDAAVFSDQAGFSFRPTSNLVVTALGYHFDEGATNASYTVELFDGSWLPLASATLSASGSAPGQIIYTNITPRRLPAGSTIFLVCHDANVFAGNGARFWSGNYVWEGTTGSFEVAPELEYLGATVGRNLYGGTNAPQVLWVGPSFRFLTAADIIPAALRIEPTESNTVRISWSATDVLGQLQTTTDLGMGMTDVLIPPVVEGTDKVLELPATEAQAFFRLVYRIEIPPATLQISLTESNTVRVSWSAEDVLGQLQTTTDLQAGMTNVPTAPSLDGASRVVELPATEAQAFFRLVYPRVGH
jgi:hypothetical protein